MRFRLYRFNDSMLVFEFGLFLWCGLVTKFAMTNSPTGIANINTASQGDRAEYDHSSGERQR